MKALSKFVLFTILRWKITHTFPLALKKYIIIVAPHTSWVDFPISILVRMSSGIKIHFIAKNTLFKPPFGFLFRALGGMPVNRNRSNNLVSTVVDIFNSKDEFRISLSPEGTRKKVEKWKTGFYYIAKGANVPIVMVALNYGNKEVKISEPYYITENKERDFEFFHSFYKAEKEKTKSNLSKL